MSDWLDRQRSAVIGQIPQKSIDYTSRFPVTTKLYVRVFCTRLIRMIIV